MDGDTDTSISQGKCFVCKQDCHSQQINLTKETKRKHSLKSVLEIILKSEIENVSEEKNNICERCCDAIEQYDDLYLKLLRIEEDLERKYRSTELPKQVCNICGKVFKSEGGLEAHVKQSHEGNSTPWSCHLCGKSFTRKASLEEHIDRHRGLKQRHCQICDKYFYQTAYWRHMTVQHNSLRTEKKGGSGSRCKCSQCGKVLASDQALKLHQESCGSVQPSLQCGYCPPNKRKSFPTAVKLNLHIRNVHTKVANSHLCVECGQTFSNYHTMYQHQKRIHPSLEPEESEGSVPDNMLLKAYICAYPDCRAGFDQIQNLQKHQEEKHRHEDGGEVDEENIENTDVNIIYIADIEDDNGDNESNLVGKKIDLEFVNVSDFGADIHETNSNSENVSEIMVSARPAELGESVNLLLCNYCGNSYKNEESRVLHIKTVHADQKPYTCTICNKAFSLQRYLTQHQQSHFSKDKFKCNLCDKSFSSNKILKRHARTHTGEKPYRCEFCSKTFAAASNLSEHRTLHTGRMPYQCKDCNEKFRLWTTLKKHLVKCKAVS